MVMAVAQLVSLKLAIDALEVEQKLVINVMNSVVMLRMMVILHETMETY